MVSKEIRKSFLSQKSFIPYHKGQPQSFISVEFFSEHQKVFLHVESSIIFTVSFNMCKYTLVFIYHIKYFHDLLSLNTNLLLKLEIFLEGIKEPQNLPPHTETEWVNKNWQYTVVICYTELQCLLKKSSGQNTLLNPLWFFAAPLLALPALWSWGARAMMYQLWREVVVPNKNERTLPRFPQSPFKFSVHF